MTASPAARQTSRPTPKDAYTANAIDAVLAGKAVANAARRCEGRQDDRLPGSGQGVRARQHLLREDCRADPPGQVRHLPPEGRHRSVRDELVRGRERLRADDPRSRDGRPHAAMGRRSACRQVVERHVAYGRAEQDAGPLDRGRRAARRRRGHPQDPGRRSSGLACHSRQAGRCRPTALLRRSGQRHGRLPAMQVDNPFKDDAWLRAVAFKPGERTVLHHITSGYVGRPDGAAGEDSRASSVGSYVPGAGIQVYNDGTGAPVPDGGKLSYSMHYTPTGKAATDATEIGYYLLKTPPEIIRRAAVISDAGPAHPGRRGPPQGDLVSRIPGRRGALQRPPARPLSRLQRRAEAEDAGRQGDAAPLGAEVRLQLAARLRPDRSRCTIKTGTKLIVTWIYDNSDAQPGQPRSEGERDLGRADLGRDDVLPRQLSLGGRDQQPTSATTCRRS